MKENKCLIPFCKSKPATRGLCSYHQKLMRKGGKSIDEFETFKMALAAIKRDKDPNAESNKPYALKSERTKERIRARKRAYYYAHRQETLTRRKKWYAIHKKIILANKRRRYHEKKNSL